MNFFRVKENLSLCFFIFFFDRGLGFVQVLRAVFCQDVLVGSFFIVRSKH